MPNTESHDCCLRVAICNHRADIMHTSAVHTHMTNTRITDPEILEMNYPLRLEAFTLRQGSGGGGSQQGGDGVLRIIRALEPAVCTLVSSSRRTPPFGLEGGTAASTGDQIVLRADGTMQAVPGIVSVGLETGDAIRLETPGGGGFGRP